MDKSEARRIAEKWCHKLRWAMQLQSWKIDLVWGHIGGKGDAGMMGMCRADPDYHRATIEIDPELHDDEAELLDTLMHELLHVMHAETHLLRRQSVRLLPGDASVALCDTIDHVAERTVHRMQRMITDGLGLDPKQFCRLAARAAQKRTTTTAKKET